MALAFLTGVAVAVPARAWMRLIAPDPEFTWSGTIAIAVGFGMLFAGAGLCLAARQRGWGRAATRVARVVGCILILPAFGGAGLLAFPSVLFGGLALAHPRWPLLIRAALALVACAAAMVALSTIPADGLHVARAVLGIVLYPVLLWPLILAARIPLSPVS